MNKPTDVEIDELWRFEASKNWDSTLAMRTSFTRAALAKWGQPVAQQGMAYAALPESLILAVDRWFSANTGLGGCSDKDVRELAELFYAVTHAGGRESVDDALAIVESFGPGISGINDTYARQILLAEEVKRLRASHWQAPAGTQMEPIAEVIEELENDGNGWCAKVRWLYNPVPVGEQLYWPQPVPATQESKSHE